MAYASTFNLEKIVGSFTEKDCGHVFEYAMATIFPEDKFMDYPHKIFVGNNGETRFANVKKTVAYIVTDETEDGLVIEKWNIKRNWTL